MKEYSLCFQTEFRFQNPKVTLLSETTMISRSSTTTSVLRVILLMIFLGFSTFTFSKYQLLYTYLPHNLTDYLASDSATPQIDWYTTRLLDERLPVRPKPQVRRWNICVCSMVHNEVPFLAEWIEHHRLQGVNHFVLYDYRSTDLSGIAGNDA